jgi:hypothetical protein
MSGTEVLLGWILGMATVGGPQIALYILKLRKQIDFLQNPEENANLTTETLAEKRP